MNLIESIFKNGGITLDQTGNPVVHSRGYYVSLASLDRILVKDLNEEKIRDCLTMLKKIFGHVNSAYLGLWIDNDECYIDMSVHFETELHALYLGRKFNQLAIWDCEKSMEIRIKGREIIEGRLSNKMVSCPDVQHLCSQGFDTDTGACWHSQPHDQCHSCTGGECALTHRVCRCSEKPTKVNMKGNPGRDHKLFR